MFKIYFFFALPKEKVAKRKGTSQGRYSRLPKHFRYVKLLVRRGFRITRNTRRGRHP